METLSSFGVDVRNLNNMYLFVSSFVHLLQNVSLRRYRVVSRFHIDISVFTPTKLLDVLAQPQFAHGETVYLKAECHLERRFHIFPIIYVYTSLHRADSVISINLARIRMYRFNCIHTDRGAFHNQI